MERDMETKGNVVIIGAGRSGRGYLAELCFLENYDITLADTDEELVTKLQQKGRYISFRQNDEGNDFLPIEISGYRAVHIHRDRAEYMEKLREADIIFTATFDDAFESIADDFTEMLRLRMDTGCRRQFVFLLGANYIGLYDYYSKALREKLNEEEYGYFKEWCVMAESIIYRVSSFPSPEQKAEDPLSIQSDNFNVLQVNTGRLPGPAMWSCRIFLSWRMTR